MRGVWSRVAGGLDFGFRTQVFGGFGFRVSDKGFQGAGVSDLGYRVPDTAKTPPSLPTAHERFGAKVQGLRGQIVSARSCNSVASLRGFGHRKVGPHNALQRPDSGRDCLHVATLLDGLASRGALASVVGQGHLAEPVPVSACGGKFTEPKENREQGWTISFRSSESVAPLERASPSASSTSTLEASPITALSWFSPSGGYCEPDRVNCEHAPGGWRSNTFLRAAGGRLSPR